MIHYSRILYHFFGHTGWRPLSVKTSEINRLFSLQTIKALCYYPPITGIFPSPRTSNTQSVSMPWRHHGVVIKNRLTKCMDFRVCQNDYRNTLQNILYHNRVSRALYTMDNQVDITCQMPEVMRKLRRSRSGGRRRLYQGYVAISTLKNYNNWNYKMASIRPNCYVDPWHYFQL